MSLSESKLVICKLTNFGETEFKGSSIKRMKLHDDVDDSDVLLSLARTVSSSSSSLAYSVSDSGGFSFTTALSEKDDHRSSTISSGCSSSEFNEIATDTCLPFLDLEAHQISETEISELITSNFRKQASQSNEIQGEIAEMDSTERRDQQKPEKTEKSPTQAELDEFFSTAERCEQKRFTEKYNYDIVNDTPLEGRYEWIRLKQ